MTVEEKQDKKDKMFEWIKLAIQVGAIVWWAATTNSHLGNIDETLKTFSYTVNSIGTTVNGIQIIEADHGARITNLEKEKKRP